MGFQLVYDSSELFFILGEDGRERLVKIASAQDALMQPGPEAGGERVYNLNTGVYDVAVDAGPSYATQREEAREVMLHLALLLPRPARRGEGAPGRGRLGQPRHTRCDETAVHGEWVGRGVLLRPQQQSRKLWCCYCCCAMSAW